MFNFYVDIYSQWCINKGERRKHAFKKIEKIQQNPRLWDS